MLTRLEVTLKSHLYDPAGQGVARDIRQTLNLPVGNVRTIKVYTLEGVDEQQVQSLLGASVLHDPVLHTAAATPGSGPDKGPLAKDFDWLVEVGFRPGVTDNEGRTASGSVALVLGALGLGESAAHKTAVYTSTQYLLTNDPAAPLSRQDVERIGKDLLANNLIQRITVRSRDEGPVTQAQAARVTGKPVDEVASIGLSAMSDDEMMAFSRANTLALSLEEMRAIRDHYAAPDVKAARQAAGLPADPTDAEVEMLAQTWSEHCKHKIFNASIRYKDETGKEQTVNSLFKNYISGPTKTIRAAKARTPGQQDLCLSVFVDNAGVFKFDADTSACVKVETHNSPSALDPYGGALTGIVGVNRDPMGTGIGANLVANTNVFCFASPFYDEAERGPLPPRLLHPRRVLEGVRTGVEHGGNKSGIPTVNGSLVFDERYLGKPLVYCGTIGTLPATVAGKPSHEKGAMPGDAIVMCGGRIGKDGIHGATFSSEELHEESPATAVQIGDPITQKMMYDFLMRARDAGLYSAITDNGAGGLSSSVGEMAEGPGGAELDLAKAPLKYDGLRPWEILLSEAQERMTLAVPQDKLEPFLSMAREMGVEASVLGAFTDSGHFRASFGAKPVADLPMEFLHEGVPQLRLSAAWKSPQVEKPLPKIMGDADSWGELLRRILGRLNVCSKEYVVRQYDHEVQGGSVIKPMVGAHADGPSDAGVIRPVLSSERGLVMSHGICPKYSDFDTYWMTAGAVDEAVRNAVATGADPDQMVGVDNFCWCDPVQSDKTPDGEYKLAQLVRSCRALAHFCTAYGVPCISGKDSMKNDYTGGGEKISIPPTLLYTVVGIVPDIKHCVSSDFKHPGEYIYVLGRTLDETAGSEVAAELGYAGQGVPQVDAQAAMVRYRAAHQAMRNGLITACHDCSDGGLAAALAEMSIGGRLGADVNLDAMPAPVELPLISRLFAESHSRLLVTVKPGREDEFEAAFAGQQFARLGQVTGQDRFVIQHQGVPVLDQSVRELAEAFKGTLGW